MRKRRILSEEHKKKIGRANKGRKHTEETKKKMSVSKKGKYKGEKSPHWGKKQSEEHRKKVSIAKKGKKVSEETKRKIGDAFRGRILTKAHRRKISIALKGKKGPWQGKKLSEETKKKLSIAHKGKKLSEETRKKMSAYQLGRTGKLSRNWQGGVSFEPYCELWYDKEFKNYIKERDGNRCFNPQCSNKFNQLGIHHVDYIKKNCEPKNLCTLCVSCNAKANVDRGFYTKWYREMLTLRYGYKYERSV